MRLDCEPARQADAAVVCPTVARSRRVLSIRVMMRRRKGNLIRERSGRGRED
jgi:hypothetical protein